MTGTINDMRAEAVADIEAMFASESAAPEVVAEEIEIPEEEAENTADLDGNETEPDAVADGEEVTDEEAEVEPDEGPAVDPPHFWSKEEKEQFSSWPRDVQEAVKAKMDDNERYINTQKMEVAEAKKSAAKEAEQLSAIAKRVEAAASAAESRFGDKWDWFTPAEQARLAGENQSEYIRLKALYDADLYTAREATAARDATERLEREKWVAEQAEQLRSALPELFTPEGKKLGEDLKDYLKSTGAGDEDLAELSAGAWVIAHKAMLYDKAKAAKPIVKKTAPTTMPSKAPPPARETVQQAQRKARDNAISNGTAAQRRAAIAQSLIDDGIA